MDFSIIQQIDPEVERNLYRNTSFDRYELRLLFALVGGEEEISVDQIITLLRADQEIKSILTFLLSSFTVINDKGMMPVEDFIRCMSIISRGLKREKLELVFNIIRTQNNPFVLKEELLQLGHLTENLLKRYNFGLANMGSPEESVYDIFGFDDEDPTAGKAKLNRKEFLTRAELDPDVYRCFGLFDFFYYMLIKPIEEQLHHGMDRPRIKGKLHREKQLLFARWYVDSWCEVRDGFMVTYKKYQKNVPRRVICLQHTVVKIMDDDELIAHNLKIGAKVHTIHHAIQRTRRPSLGVDAIRVYGIHFIVQAPKGNYTLIASDENKVWDWVSTLRANARGGYQFQSFSPVRTGIACKWYTTAKEYYHDVADAIEGATKEVFITGWWLTPKIYLKREYPFKKDWRLDHMLDRAAERGVHVYVLIWDEITLGVNLGSRWTKVTLEGLHKNIRVIRHPRFQMSWSHHQKTVIVDQNIAFLGGIDLCHGRYDDESYLLLDEDEMIFPGGDYRNVCLMPSGRPSISSRSLQTCQLDRKKQCRMPWHDTAIRVEGRAARDVAANFIQRWNHAKASNGHSSLLYPYAMPSLDDVPDPSIPGTCTCQILRSVSEWSAGQPVEDSIYKAHINLINTAQHYIYIQNQYFISSTTTKRPKNKIALAISRRIRRAIENDEVFRVIILLPVHSEGFLQEKRTSVLVEWNLRTIHAIVYELEKEFPEKVIWNYISVNSLRNWVATDKHAITEQVYVHSKLMIVDDEWVICGSANVNDRSMRGTRDSEIAAVIREEITVDTIMNGHPYRASKFAFTMRMRLWKAHLGIGDDEQMTNQIVDPIHDATYHGIWRSIARVNTSLYIEVFGPSIPESCSTVEEHDRSKNIPWQLAEPLKRIRGFLVEYPFKLLSTQAQAPANPPKWFSKIFL